MPEKQKKSQKTNTSPQSKESKDQRKKPTLAGEMVAALKKYPETE